ncbi:transcription factor domain-containing protein [Aspergillus undulatus]|uniref:transcription factor domain-containing protein n=1 Tax=Aspergillus undulatus TaxID=1810928 RepID=UPI003CCE4E8E
MSAAHLASSIGDAQDAALDHRSKAASYLNSDIAVFKDTVGAHRPSGTKPLEALLGSILLGMTEAWHNPSYLGITHLHGARILFKRWISNNQEDPEFLTPGGGEQVQGTIVGLMAYWEAMASFLINQPIDATAYLNAHCCQGSSSKTCPNPWTGVCTPLFAYLARTGSLVRQLSLTDQLSITGTATDVGSQIRKGLLQSARETEHSIFHYRIPRKDLIEDTGDAATPAIHLQRLAQIYRLATLIELYRSFPGLLERPLHDAGRITAAENRLTSGLKILAMATSCLSLVAAVPQTSGINCLLVLPLIIAGSTLQTARAGSTHYSEGLSSWHILSADIHLIAGQEDVQLQWRDFVRARLQHILRYVGITAISRATEIVERVWARSDLQAAASPGSEHFVQWTEVMVEEKLETVFG